MTLESVPRTIAPGYNVHLTKVATGETRTYRYDYAWEPHHDYMWHDGNYSCDCNRELFFCRAVDEDEPDDDESVCSDGLFRVRITADDDKELYRDD